MVHVRQYELLLNTSVKKCIMKGEKKTYPSFTWLKVAGPAKLRKLLYKGYIIRANLQQAAKGVRLGMRYNFPLGNEMKYKTNPERRTNFFQDFTTWIQKRIFSYFSKKNEGSWNAVHSQCYYVIFLPIHNITLLSAGLSNNIHVR